MIKEEMKHHRCCFTGHRPQKLNHSKRKIKRLLEKAVDNAIAKGYVTFITGMAQGTDIWAAEIILKKRKRNDNLHLICAVPHPGFENRRSLYEKLKYKNIIKKADFVKLVSENYYKGCYQKRNEFMVDRSGLVIAVFNGKPSGTKNTIDYAKKKGVAVINVLDNI